MTFYQLNDRLHFGKHRGKCLDEIVLIDPSYIEWCIIALNHFYIDDYHIDELKKINPNFSISEKAKQILDNKYSSWYDAQSEYEEFLEDQRQAHEYESRFETYEQWLRSEFGDDAETAYWNMD